MQRGPHLSLLCLLAFAPFAYAGEVPMKLDSAPSGATVEVGGSTVGTTPLTLRYPTSYFKAPKTVWARHLSAPLVFILRKPGFVEKRVELGQGPNSWVSLDGSNRFDYYLLRNSYTIQLEVQQETPPAGGLSYLDELRELAKLREEGIISDAEFAEKKAVLLGLGATAPEMPAAPQPSATDQPMKAVLSGGFTSMDGDPWTYSWQLTVTNHALTPLSIDAEIQFKSADGAIVATLPLHDLFVGADSSAPFAGTFDLAAEASRRVEKVTLVGTHSPAERVPEQVPADSQPQ